MDIPVRIAVVEDRHLSQLGIRKFFEITEGYKLVGVFPQVKQLEEFLKQGTIDILLLDDTQPYQETDRNIRWLLHQFPHLLIIVFGSKLNVLSIRRYLEAGARAFVYKGELLTHTLADAVRAVLEGKPYLSPEANALIMEQDMISKQITPRMLEVLILMAVYGYSVIQTAAKLDVSSKVIYETQRQMRQIFNVNSNEEVVYRAFLSGLFDNDNIAGIDF